jgi:dolichol-phosphate mannosyltransferase
MTEGEKPKKARVDLQVVIPAYNEVAGILFFLKELTGILDSFELKWKILVVDDHSEDATFEQVVSLDDERVHCLRLSRNSGSHLALRAGLEQSDATMTLCIAADGQDDPHCLEEMIGKMEKGADVVWALREKRQGETPGYRWSARLFYVFLEKMVQRQNRSIDLNRADFFLLSRKVVAALMGCRERHSSLMGLLSWMGFRQEAVTYVRRERSAGHSRWNMQARVRLALDWLLSFSGLPLKMITLAGFIFALLGFIYTIVIFFNRFFNDRVPDGWSSLMVVVMILGGVQMIMLGIVGQYLWRTFDESKKRPLYFIEKSSFTLEEGRGT